MNPSLTTQEQIEFIAKFMGITVVRRKGKWMKETCEGGGALGYTPWNLFENWNIWRKVEEKVMEDLDLLEMFLLTSDWRGTAPTHHYMQADLPTRIQSLISAHIELYGS